MSPRPPFPGDSEVAGLQEALGSELRKNFWESLLVASLGVPAFESLRNGYWLSLFPVFSQKCKSIEVAHWYFLPYWQCCFTFKCLWLVLF